MKDRIKLITAIDSISIPDDLTTIKRFIINYGKAFTIDTKDELEEALYYFEQGSYLPICTEIFRYEISYRNPQFEIIKYASTICKYAHKAFALVYDIPFTEKQTGQYYENAVYSPLSHNPNSGNFFMEYAFTVYTHLLISNEITVELYYELIKYLTSKKLPFRRCLIIDTFNVINYLINQDETAAWDLIIDYDTNWQYKTKSKYKELRNNIYNIAWRNHLLSEDFIKNLEEAIKYTYYDVFK